MRFLLLFCFQLYAFYARAEHVITLSKIGNEQYFFSKSKSDVFVSSTKEMLSFSQAKNGLPFESLNSPALNKGPMPDYHWVKFELINDFKNRETVFITLKNSAINNIRFYVLRDDKVDSCVTGDNFPFNQRPYPFCNFSFPVEMNPMETVMVLMELDKRNENFFCGFDFRNEDAFHEMEMSVYLTFGLFIGIILLSILMNLILYFGVKDKSHLWYSLYAFSNLLLILAYDGLDFQFLYPEHPFFSNISRYIFTGTTYILLFTLFNAFVIEHKRNTRLKLFCNVMKGLHLLLILSSVMIFVFNQDSVWMKIALFRLLSFISTFSMLSFIAISIFKIKEGNKDAVLFLAATILLFLGGLEYVLNINGFYTGLLFFHSVIPSNMQLCVVIEVLLVFIAIALKFKDYKRDSIEMKLAIVTADSLLKDKELALVNEERKRIASDLHDGIGSMLFGVKLKLQSIMMTTSKNTTILDEITNDLNGVSEGIRSLIWRLNQHRSFSLMVKSLVEHARGIFNKRNVFFHFDQNQLIEISCKEEFRRDFSLMFLEICNNTHKHSSALAVTFRLFIEEGNLVFDWKEEADQLNSYVELNFDLNGLGLKSISDRTKRWEGRRAKKEDAYHYLIYFPLEKILE